MASLSNRSTAGGARARIYLRSHSRMARGATLDGHISMSGRRPLSHAIMHGGDANMAAVDDVDDLVKQFYLA